MEEQEEESGGKHLAINNNLTAIGLIGTILAIHCLIADPCQWDAFAAATFALELLCLADARLYNNRHIAKYGLDNHNVLGIITIMCMPVTMQKYTPTP